MATTGTYFGNPSTTVTPVVMGVLGEEPNIENPSKAQLFVVAGPLGSRVTQLIWELAVSGGGIGSPASGLGFFFLYKGISTSAIISFLGSPTGGTFEVSFNGVTIGPITYSSGLTAGTVQTAFSTAGFTTVSVSGSNGGPFTITGLPSATATVLGIYSNSLTGGSSPYFAVAPTNYFLFDTIPINTDGPGCLSGVSSFVTYDETASYKSRRKKLMLAPNQALYASYYATVQPGGWVDAVVGNA